MHVSSPAGLARMHLEIVDPVVLVGHGGHCFLKISGKMLPGGVFFVTRLFDAAGNPILRKLNHVIQHISVGF